MHRPPSTPLRTPALAGWLFADLFLVLFIIGIASIPALPKPPSQHAGRSHQRHHGVHHQLGMDTRPVTLTLPVPPASIADPFTHQAAITTLIRMLDSDFAARHLQGKRVGFVLVFASGPTTAIGQALKTADSVATALRQHDPAFNGAGSAGYWTGSGNAIELKIFFFAQ